MNRETEGAQANQFQLSGRPIESIEFVAPGSSPDVLVKSVSEAKPITLNVSPVSKWWHSQFSMLVIAFIILASVAGVLIFLSPTPKLAEISNKVVDVDGVAAKAPLTEVELPWDDSRRAQARADSQDVLSDVLALKKELEGKGVLDWSSDRFEAALAYAENGDVHYKEQKFVEAVSSYRSALDALVSLKETIPEILAAQILLGNQALVDGKSNLAKELFKRALSLDQNSISALTGMDRSANLDQLLELLNSSQSDELEFKQDDKLTSLLSAKSTLEQAQEMDGRLEQVSESLARVNEAIADKQYRNAMSSGFKALFKQKYSIAQKSFSNALKYRANDPTAKSAYRQSLASDTRASLVQLLRNAEKFEANEKWQRAVVNYQTVLQRDSNQIDAKLGLIRSQVRNELNHNLLLIMTDILALSRSTQREEAMVVLEDARAIINKGPTLKQQIANIEKAFEGVDRTINISVSSDGLSRVSLTKEGAKRITLGEFTHKKLALKPGRYVVSCSRLGFHDVRKELIIRPSSNSADSLVIQCDKAIASSGKAHAKASNKAVGW